MRYMLRGLIAAGVLGLFGCCVAGAADLADAVQLVSSSTASTAPPTQTFTIATAGSYTVTLSDLQLPSALASLQLAIVTFTSNVLTLTVSAPATTVTSTVTLQPGTYSAQVLAGAGAGALGGTFSVQVAPAAGGTAVWQYDDSVAAAAAATSGSGGQSALSTQFTVATGGTYQLTVADLAFPAALQSLKLIVLNHCGTTVGCVTAPVSPTPSSGPNVSESLNLPAGTYDLFVVADADSTALAGLYSIKIASGTASAYSNVVTVGSLPAPSAITVPSASTVSLQLVDLATPAALASLKAVVTQGTSVLQSYAGANTQTFAAAASGTAGPVQVYVAAQPGASGQGAYEIYATSGTTVLADIAQPALTTGSFGYAYPTTVKSAGSYQLGVYDFQQPQPFSILKAMAVQAGVVLASTASSSSTFTAAAAPLTILVFPVFGSSGGDGLFATQLTAAGSSGSEVFQTTQGVGALFSTQTLTVTTAGAYAVTLTDLKFPVALASLTVYATNGYTLAGQVSGTGTANINFAAGTYVLNVLAQSGASASYGMYGLDVTPAPAATLSASAASVTSGGSVTLTWSSSNATACTAAATPAASGWSGSLATSGSQTSGALTGTSTTFTLTCSGANGTTATATATVNITAAATTSKGGGGSLDAGTLLLLLAMAGAIALARRANAAR